MTDPNAQPDPSQQPPQQPQQPQYGAPQPGQPQYGQPQYAAPQPAAPLTADQDKLWASLAHFGGVLYVLPSLLIWLILKDRGERTRVEGKEALNWQITFLIIWIVWVIIAGILTIPFFLIGIGWLLTLIGFLIWAGNAALSIIGGIRVQQGGSYRYPFNFRFIK